MSPDEKLRAAVEIVKALAWPATAVWLVWYLRDEVKRVATRMTEIGLTGAKFAPPTEQIPTPPQEGVSAITPEPPITPVSTAPLSQKSRATGAQEYIAKLKQFISPDQIDPHVEGIRRDLHTTAGPEPADQIEVLLYLAASLSIQLVHERNYNVIFGSQLNLMAQANTDIGSAPAVAKGLYEAAKAAHPEIYKTYTFEQWMGFLMAAGLVSTAQNGNVVLTPYGRGLLKYILDRHLSVNRPN